jgi:AhpD family alkylhydroperoxidase
MHQYRIHTIESAPEKSKQALHGLQQKFGLIPHLAATMAESPVLLNAFVGAFGTFHAGAFTPAEKQVLLLTNAVTNACSWAVAFHSTLALKDGVHADDVRAIRERRLPDDARLAALSTLTRGLIEKRGHVDERALTGFIEAGFRHDQVLEVIAGIAVSTLANYAGNITQPAVEEPFKQQLWQPQA